MGIPSRKKGVYSEYEKEGSCVSEKKKKKAYLHVIHVLYMIPRALLVTQLVKNQPVMWGTWVRSLGWEEPLEKGTATHFGILAWRIQWTLYSPWGSQRFMLYMIPRGISSVYTYLF